MTTHIGAPPLGTPLPPPAWKQCSKCRRTWRHDHFGHDWRNASGLRSQCRHCERRDNRARYYRQKAAAQANFARWG